MEEVRNRIALPPFLVFTVANVGPQNVTIATQHFTLSLVFGQTEEKFIRGEILYQWSLAQHMPLPRRNPSEWFSDFTSFWETKELEKVIVYLLDLEQVDTLNGIVLAGDFKRSLELTLEERAHEQFS